MVWAAVSAINLAEVGTYVPVQKASPGSGDRRPHRGVTGAVCFFDSKLIKADFTWDHLHARRETQIAPSKVPHRIHGKRHSSSPRRIVLTALLL